MQGALDKQNPLPGVVWNTTTLTRWHSGYHSFQLKVANWASGDGCFPLPANTGIKKDDLGSSFLATYWVDIRSESIQHRLGEICGAMSTTEIAGSAVAFFDNRRNGGANGGGFI